MYHFRAVRFFVFIIYLSCKSIAAAPHQEAAFCLWLRWLRHQGAMRGEVRSLCVTVQWQEICYFVAVGVMTQYTDRWHEKWVTCCVLGGLELLQDQLTRQKEAAEQKLDPQLNYKSVPAVQSSNLDNSFRVAWLIMKSIHSLLFHTSISLFLYKLMVSHAKQGFFLKCNIIWSVSTFQKFLFTGEMMTDSLVKASVVHHHSVNVISILSFNFVSMFLTVSFQPSGIHYVHWLLFRYPTSPLTPQSQSPAWSPSSCGGCLVGQFSCLLWPLDRQNNTTAIANPSQTQSPYHHGPQHCRFAPHHSSLSLLLTPAGRRM